MILSGCVSKQSLFYERSGSCRKTVCNNLPAHAHFRGHDTLRGKKRFGFATRRNYCYVSTFTATGRRPVAPLLVAGTTIFRLCDTALPASGYCTAPQNSFFNTDTPYCRHSTITISTKGPSTVIRTIICTGPRPLLFPSCVTDPPRSDFAENREKWRERNITNYSFQIEHTGFLPKNECTATVRDNSVSSVYLVESSSAVADTLLETIQQ